MKSEIIRTLLFIVLLTGILGCILNKQNLSPTPPRTKVIVSFATISIATNHTFIIPIQYPTNINLSAYCWQYQKSTNLTDWTDVPTPCLWSDIFATNSLPMMFFRVVGVPQ